MTEIIVTFQEFLRGLGNGINHFAINYFSLTISKKTIKYHRKPIKKVNSLNK
jgi:hypothetical protein